MYWCFEKIIKSSIFTSTLSNLHVYTTEPEKLHLNFFERKYSNNVHSSNCVFVGIWKDERLHISCKNCKRWDGSVVIWNHLSIVLLEEIVLLTTGRVCKIQKLTRVCSQYPTLTLHFAGLRVYDGKSVFVKSWNTVRGKRTTDTWVVGYGWLIAG